ncbi:phage tail fiber domain-containing protein [Pseudomonas oryzihabitans]|uniref:phage tail fiber domain-containing protein n=1 Tax=Pseudomonas oryzihabitans TaxID=47885 RepID=UPI0015E38DF7|nr:phage tail fiber protein [Pseudomonas psychrotolerans]MBA1211527.1 hypothetical protein [Pseudomonas psychrotolerans]
MAVTTVYTYPLDGSKKDFTVPFEYLARKFVAVTLVGTAGRKVLVLNTDYRFTSKTTIQTTQAWAPGSGYTTIEVKRNTSATDRLVSFADGSILRATDMTLSQVQTMHVAEEARNAVSDTISVNGEGMLDARGRRLVNLQSAKDGTDAVTLQQVMDWSQSALNSANAAKASQDAASTSAGAAKTSESSAADHEYKAYLQALQSADSAKASAASQGAAKTSETNASASAQKAAESEYKAYLQALNSADSAKASASSATNAQTQADRAKTEADKLGNANAFMGTINDIGTDYVRWKDAYQLRGISFRAGRHVLNDGGLTSDGSDGRLRVGGSDVTMTGLSYLYMQPKTATASAHFWVVKPDGTDRGVLFNQGDGSWILRTGNQKAVSLDTAGNWNVPNECWINGKKAMRIGDRIGAGTQTVFQSNGTNFGVLNGTGNEALQVSNGGNNAAAAIMSFHREGSFAAYFGLDVDNQWAVGGWSMGTRRFVLWHEGNLNPSEYVRFDNLRQELGGRSAGEIGTYGMFQTVDGYNRNPGDLIGGGGLRWGSHNSVSGSSPTGTWRCCGYGNQGGVTLWLRVN